LLRGFPSLFLSVPNFVIGLVLIHLFGFQLGVFRVIEPNSFWATVFAAIALGIPVSAQIAEVLIANLDHESRPGIRGRRARPRPRANASLRQAPAQAVLAAGRHRHRAHIGELLGGSLITETVFGRTGLGSLVQRSVSTQDLPVLQAIVSLAAVVFVLVNLIADLVYPLLDPRVKLLGAPEFVARPRADESTPAFPKR
jgi:peptide/nickel transport system permease protein